MKSLKYQRRRKSPPRKKMQWSKHQRKVFDDVAGGDGHTIVLAAPGSGKSTTIVESLYYIPENIRNEGRVLVCAFNSSIVKELETKVPGDMDVKTFHKVGFQSVRKNWDSVYQIGPRSVDVKSEVADMLAIEQVGDEDETNGLRKSMVRTMSLAKAELAESPEEIEDVIAAHGLGYKTMNDTDFAFNVWEMMQKTRDEPRILNGKSVISFDDMLWLPYVHGWDLDKYDRVFVDEAQDLSAVRTELVLGSMGMGSRLTAVGDQHQAIYEFCGATPSIIDKLGDQLRTKYLPLSVSYRLPKRIVELAKAVNPDISAAPDAIDGVVNNIEIDDVYSYLRGGVSVLSRTNFPLIKLAFRLVANGVKANIQGKDIGDRFLWRISVWDPEDVADLKRKIGMWRDHVIEILTEKRYPVDRILDEAKSLLLFCDGAANLDEVQKRIKTFFSDTPSQIKLSTAHKAKGLEWDNVIMLENTFKFDKGEEEARIWYVAVTRAKKSLTIASGKV
jgi:superfamily I DNA/RNA helicase